MRIALIGGTGLVGSLLVRRLLAGGHEVHRLQRSGVPAPSVHVAPAERWPDIVSGLAPDAAVSALGTTMRKAGSEPAFRAVDLDMVATFAEAAARAGTRRMVTVSSVGADSGSANFYLRIKGEMEEAVSRFGFERVDIFRPGLLRGERGPERRLRERIGIALSPLVNLALRGSLSRFAAIDAAIVADAIAASLADHTAGHFVHHNREIRALAGIA